ncbi:MAG TPA: hypothetical protein VH518_15500 [Tepidisphaeraceae bacterium]|jgi:predicted ATP-grasp superfamily ATP-dependent carboligase
MNEIKTARRAFRHLQRWLRSSRVQRGKPLAVILGGSCNGLSFARSLGRRGIPTLLLDSERLLGTYTRFGKVVLLPPASESPDQWITFLELVSSLLPQKGILFATSDVHTLLVSRNRERLERHFNFLVADSQALERIVNKRLQYETAQAAGIPMPAVYFPETLEEARSMAGRVAYPCILKPYTSQPVRTKLAGKKVALVRSSGELITEYHRLNALGVPLMIQEIIPGGDDTLYGYLSFWDREGREVAWLTKRKLRQSPPHFGNGSLHVTLEAPEVAVLSRRLLQAFSYRGFACAEFKLDARDGVYRLVEINPRTPLSNQVAIASGVDFPWIGYRYLTGQQDPAALAAPFRRNVTMVDEELDIQSFLTSWKAGSLTLGAWLRSLLSVRATAVWAWDDPMPMLAGIGRFFRMCLTGNPHASPRVAPTIMPEAQLATLRS